VCDLINNALHNLAQDQRDATQFDKVKKFMLYVSYQHALKMFEVELSKWEMEVALMCVETLHTAVVGWEKDNDQWIEKASWDWNPIWQILTSNQHILKKMP
jgi:hypothetical protein